MKIEPEQIRHAVSWETVVIKGDKQPGVMVIFQTARHTSGGPVCAESLQLSLSIADTTDLRDQLSVALTHLNQGTAAK